jgi:hypothetical protein
MTIQSGHPDFLRSAMAQLTLLGAAAIVLVFFAWTYID